MLYSARHVRLDARPAVRSLRVSPNRRGARASGSASASPGLDSAFVLGSGWSAAADDLGELIGSCELAELPGFAKPTVLGHGGALRVVAHQRRARSRRCFTGRTHFYEGRGVRQVVHGVRPVAAAGASTIVLTNGCGGLNRDWAPGHRGADLPTTSTSPAPRPCSARPSST